MYRDIIERLLSHPQRGQIKVDFDLAKKIFHLSIPIFSSQTALPESVKKYVDARKNSTFKPHATSFREEGNKVLLVQEVPFEADFQETLRRQVDLFLANVSEMPPHAFRNRRRRKIQRCSAS